MTTDESIAGLIARLGAAFEAACLAFGHGTDNALDEAAWLVLGALGLPPAVPPTVLETRLSSAETVRVEALAARRLEERVPTAYLLGTAWFCGLRFSVDERVLVPRSPLAELIEERFSPWVARPGKVRRILEIGTGSGCIAVACAYAFPAARIDATDISPGALAVAAQNVARHGLSDRIRLHRADVFEGLEGGVWDLIISNPPYVDSAAMAALPAEYRHEPASGLAAGEDGLDIVRRILEGSRDRLAPGGLLIAEVGDAMAALEERLGARLAFLWPDLERGGHGVFLLGRDDLPPSGSVL